MICECVSIRFGNESDPLKYPFGGGVSHADELIYLLPKPKEVGDLNSDDKEMAEKMVDLWTSFVKNGVPKLTSDPQFEWPPMTSTNSF